MSTIARTASGTPVASNTTGGPTPPGQSRAAFTTSSRVVQTSVSAPISRAQPEPALLRVDHQHLRPALAREQADRTGRSGRRRGSPTGSPAASRARCTARTAIDTGSAIAASAESAALDRRTPGPAAMRSSSCRPPSTWIPISVEVRRRRWAARRCTGSTARTRCSGQSATAPPTSSSARQSGPTAAIVPATSCPWILRERRVAARRRIGQLDRRRSGSPSRRCQPTSSRRRPLPAPAQRVPAGPQPPSCRPLALRQHA